MACDLCNGTKYEILWDKAERETQGKLQSVIIPGHIHSRNAMCRQCGLVYVWPKMSKEELAKFYAEDYRKIYNGKHSLEAEKRHAWSALELLGPTLGKLLDVGCSTGELVELYESHNDTLRMRGEFIGYGIEPNREHCEIAKSKGLNVENCTIEDYNPSFTFDIITMLNALEHVFSPTEVLTKINTLLNDGGYVLISVPNLYNRTIHLPVDAFLSNAHIYNFGKATITALFNKCGFKVVKGYEVIEEMGEKLYILGQKAQVDWTMPSVTERDIEATKQHLAFAQEVFDVKMVIQQKGFK